MEELYPRLQQLRAELEESAASPEHGLSVLYAIRRELLRHYDSLPVRQRLSCPTNLQNQFYHAQQALQRAPGFPPSSTSVQYASTEQALRILEQVASCPGEVE